MRNPTTTRTGWCLRRTMEQASMVPEEMPTSDRRPVGPRRGTHLGFIRVVGVDDLECEHCAEKSKLLNEAEGGRDHR